MTNITVWFQSTAVVVILVVMRLGRFMAGTRISPRHRSMPT